MDDQREDDLSREIRSHLELDAADRMAAGLSAADARRAAHGAFGSVTVAHEDARGVRVPVWIDQLFQDVRYGWRLLGRNPAFTLTAIVSMAFGIGANTVVFGLLNAALFKPLPVSQPDRLMFVYRGQSSSVSYPLYRDLRDQSQTIAGAIAYRPARIAVDWGGGAERYWGYLATANYFDVLGLTPAAGRFFHPVDDRGVNASPYVVLSYDLWQQQLSGDPTIVGRAVRVNGVPYTVLGIAPRGFMGTEAFLAPALWVPISMTPQIEGRDYLESRSSANFWMMVRKHPEPTSAQVAADLNRVVTAVSVGDPSTNPSTRLSLTAPGLLGDVLRGPVEQFVTGIMFVAGFVLLAACANLAGLLGARATDRHKEIALRVSIGAGAGRVYRQLATEALVLTGIGGVIGFAAAWTVLQALSRWHLPVEIPVQINVAPDQRVLCFGVVASICAGLLASVAPARHATRTSPSEAMKGAVRDARRWPVRDVMLVLQTALCGALVACSLVAGRGLLQTYALRPGFDAAGLSVVGFDPALAGYSRDQSGAFQRRALDEVARLPGVTAAAYAKSVPLTTDQSTMNVFAEDASAEDRQPVAFYNVSPGFFKTMETRLLAGREFEWRDTADAPAVALMNETLARQLFGTTNAVGRRFRTGRRSLVEVIGIVEDGKYFTLAEPSRAVLFQSILSQRDSETVMIVRSSEAEGRMAAVMGGVVRQMDPAIPVYGVGSVSQLIGLAYLPARVSSVALGAFGILALMLAVTGIYGLVSYAVLKRVHDIGIRRALGASMAEVLRLVFVRVALLVAVGSLIGLVLAGASERILAAVVFQASIRDPMVLMAVALTMLAVAVLSGIGPARRAIALDPLAALRQE